MESVSKLVRNVGISIILLYDFLCVSAHAEVSRIVCQMEDNTHSIMQLMLDPARQVVLNSAVGAITFPNNIPMQTSELRLDWQTTLKSGTTFKFSLDRGTLQIVVAKNDIGFFVTFRGQCQIAKKQI